MLEPLDIASLRERVVIQAQSTARDTAGQRLQTWADEATVWAAVKPLVGRELVAAQAVHDEVSHQVTLRWRAGLDASKRLHYRGRTLVILAVLDEEERRTRLQLLCAEGLATQ